MTPKDMNEASWRLANDCLDLLPCDDLPMTGLTLIHLIAVWLAAVPEGARPATYVHWLEMLHDQLDRAGVIKIHSTLEPIEERSEAVH